MAQHLEVVDAAAAPPVWAALRNEAQHVAATEPSLASLINAVILKHSNLAHALSYQLARMRPQVAAKCGAGCTCACCTLPLNTHRSQIHLSIIMNI